MSKISYIVALACIDLGMVAVAFKAGQYYELRNSHFTIVPANRYLPDEQLQAFPKASHVFDMEKDSRLIK